MKFKSEKELFETAIQNPSFINFFSKNQKKIFIEPKGLFGIPDLVVVDVDSFCETKEVHCAFAFEMKLSNWKRALIQAFRYRSFAEESYVMLDNAFIKPALRNLDVFENAKIGLISIDTNGNWFMHFQPKKNTPYCSNLRVSLENIVMSSPNIHEWCYLRF